MEDTYFKVTIIENEQFAAARKFEKIHRYRFMSGAKRDIAIFGEMVDACVVCAVGERQYTV